ncbi:MAG: O-antigen ligase family protein [Planctomycetota bacterium]
MSDELPKSATAAQRLIPFATVAVLLPAVVPWWVIVLPRLDFDVDPRSPGAEVATTLGPAGLGVLAALGTAAALFALVVHGLAGGRFAWKSALLLLPGLVLVGMHLPQRFENLWHGTGWAWGVAAGLALLHLGRWPIARRWASAVLAGFAAMLLVEAMNYRFVEHAVTVAAFEQQREVFLESRGWAEGSSEAQLYERRLRTNDAIGAIGLSNVLATLGAGLGAMGLGLLVGALRPKRGATVADVTDAARETFGGDARGRWLVGGAVFMVGVAIVALTNSTAGMAALGLGCVWVTGAAVLRLFAARTGRLSGPSMGGWSVVGAVGCVALVYAAVALRYVVWGVPGPGQVGQGIGGELSVLFRAQYWGAAWRMVTQQPSVWLLGVGPGGFGDAYLRFKSPLNPEEVTSAHGFAVEFVATLGVVGGGLWALVLVGWLARGAWGVMSDADPSATSPPWASRGVRGAVYGLLGLGGVLMGLELAVAWAEVSGPGAVWGLAWRLAAWGAFVLVGGLWWRFADDLGVRVGLVGAAVAALVHGSFDMALFQPASSAMVWAVVGLAGGSGVIAKVVERPRRIRGSAASWIWFAMLAVFVVVATGATLLGQHAKHLALAADATRSEAGQVALEHLGQANWMAGFDPAATRFMPSVAPSPTAAERAVQSAMTSRFPSVSLAVVRDEPYAEWGRLLRADDVLGTGFGHAGTWRTLAQLALQRGDQASALDAYVLAAQRSPFNLRDRVAIGDLWVRFGNDDDASASFHEALRLDDLRYLDPAKQLPEAERARVEAWLAEHDAAE